MTLGIKAAIYLGVAASIVLGTLVVTAGVLLPIVWSRNPRRRKAAEATLEHLLDLTHRITTAARKRK
jgi:hypothetical protein